MLRRLRRLRFVLLPHLTVATLALGIRLGWAHDPTCPHHAGHSAPATPATPAPHATHAAHAAHAAVATSEQPPGDSQQESPTAPCRCLDPDCNLTGVVAVLDAGTGDVLAADASTLDAALRPMPVSVSRPGAYRTHRLPFPHAPPRIDGLT